MNTGAVVDRRNILATLAHGVPPAIALVWSLFLMFSHQPWFDEIQSGRSP